MAKITKHEFNNLLKWEEHVPKIGFFVKIIQRKNKNNNVTKIY